MRGKAMCLMVGSLFLFLISGCLGFSSDLDNAESSLEPQHQCVEHWTYYGECGPENWGKYFPEANGDEQSPIDISTSKLRWGLHLPEVFVNYGYSRVSVLNNGHSVKAEILDQNNFIRIGSKRYNLDHFHFHTESEYTVNTKFADMEMHLVHKAANGELAVIGVLMEEGYPSYALDELFANLPDLPHYQDHLAAELKKPIFLPHLLPLSPYVYRFAGSLTTPPCSENVKWTVMAEPITLSKKQIGAFRAIFSGPLFPYGNRRPVQPLNGRTLYLDIASMDNGDEG